MEHLLRRVPTLLVGMVLFAFVYLACLLIVVRVVLSVTGDEIADGGTADFAAVLFDVMGIAVALLVAWRTSRRLLSRPPVLSAPLVAPVVTVALSVAWLLLAWSFSSVHSPLQVLQGLAVTAVGSLTGARMGIKRTAAYTTPGLFTTV